MIDFLDEDFSALNHYIAATHPSKLLLLTDENTEEYCLPIVLGNLTTEIPYEIISIEAGETHKNIATATQLWEIFSEFEVDRNALLLNVGGGVITDLGGFVASTYKRGFKFVNLPTTLLSMVDASIGGKTGIDHQFYKNIIGTFTFPEKIFVYPDFLRTLPFIELRSGFAEMLKHGLIASQQHWDDLKNTGLSVGEVAPFIGDSMQIKQDVVEADFKEQNLRKTLNFGHTVGHAIESLFLQNNTPIPHGEAVAAGIIMEAFLSLKTGLLHNNAFEEVKTILTKFYPKLPIEKLNDKDILEVMKNDKKNFEGKIKFSLIDAIGHCQYNCEVSDKLVVAALATYRSL